MKNLISLFSIVFLLGIVPIYAQNDEEVKSSEDTQVKAYYFHATRRCVTCQAIETISKEVINEFYTGKVSMEVFNREKDENKALVEKYQISGQTLLILKGDKVINLTNDAFLHAKNSPDKFKAKLKATIDSLL